MATHFEHDLTSSSCPQLPPITELEARRAILSEQTVAALHTLIQGKTDKETVFAGEYPYSTMYIQRLLHVAANPIEELADLPPTDARVGS